MFYSVMYSWEFTNKANLADAFLSWIGQVEGFHALPSYSDIIIIVCWNSIDFVNIAFMHSVSLESGEEIIVNKIMHKYSYLYTPNSEVNNKIIGISMKDKCIIWFIKLPLPIRKLKANFSLCKYVFRKRKTESRYKIRS